MTTHDGAQTTGPPPAAAPTYVQVPPADAHIPAAPEGFVPTSGTEYRGVTPKKAHMVAIPDVLEELKRFSDFTEVFGKTAPPFEQTQQILAAAGGWSLQRAQMRAWDLYCRTQEGLAWRDARALMERITPAFELAVTTDSTVATRYPGFARLLAASKQIARKSSATRKANDKLIAEGKEPIRGRVGKRRQKQAQKALIAEAIAQRQAESGAPVDESSRQPSTTTEKTS